MGKHGRQSLMDFHAAIKEFAKHFRIELVLLIFRTPNNALVVFGR
jgi:hypothetical protein